MNTDPSHISALFKKHLQGIASEEELRELFGYIGHNRIDGQMLSSLQVELEQTDPQSPYDKQKWDSVFTRIKDEVDAIEEVRPAKGRSFAFVKFGVAAAVAAALLITAIDYFKNDKLVHTDQQVLINDIRPGALGATLTLADGTKISVGDASAGKIASQSGVQISKGPQGQIIYKLTDIKSDVVEYNTLSTSRGQQSQVVLPDGSLVYLNSSSSLRYPTSFSNRQNREVTLTGEGYFEVAKNKDRPFLVNTDRQQVEVLGTHFNINAYSKEVRTTLAEGSVRVSTPTAFKVILPGEQAALTGSSFKISPVEVGEILAWKDGYFIFDDRNIESIMDELVRWYDIEVIYRDKLKNIGFTGKISKFRNISQVLGLLEKTGDVHFKIEGRRVVVME